MHNPTLHWSIELKVHDGATKADVLAALNADPAWTRRSASMTVSDASGDHVTIDTNLSEADATTLSRRLAKHPAIGSATLTTKDFSTIFQKIWIRATPNGDIPARRHAANLARRLPDVTRVELGEHRLDDGDAIYIQIAATHVDQALPIKARIASGLNLENDNWDEIHFVTDI